MRPLDFPEERENGSAKDIHLGNVGSFGGVFFQPHRGERELYSSFKEGGRPFYENMAVENAPGFRSINLLPGLFQLAWKTVPDHDEEFEYAVQTDLFKIG